MEFSPGSGATINATTLENQCYSIIKSIQSFERSATYNPGAEINMITSSSNDDTQVFSGNCRIFANINLAAGGLGSYSFPNPYINLPEWDRGTGGDGAASNWVEALSERFLALAFFERSSTHNISKTDPKVTSIGWELLDEFLQIPIPHNCIFSFNFTLDYEIVESDNGARTIAVEYLQGPYTGLY